MRVANVVKLTAALGLTIISGAPSFADDLSDGAKLYQRTCESCHRIGENIINPEKTMDKSTQLKTKATFKKFLSHQNGQMPAYLTIVRKDKDLQALYTYIKQLNNTKPPAKTTK